MSLETIFSSNPLKKLEFVPTRPNDHFVEVMPFTVEVIPLAVEVFSEALRAFGKGGLRYL